VSQNRVALIGMSGRMGHEICLLAEQLDITVAAGVSTKIQTAKGIRVVDSVEKLEPSSFDAVIDFSLPDATDRVLAWCVKNKKALVSGVTGISAQQKQAFAKAGEIIPVLWSPNMSLGVAVMARMLTKLSSLDGFDFQIEELHHTRKKDKPSGTALMLQERLKDAVKSQVPDPIAIRGGGIFGIHRVWAMGEEETITLEHTAMSRKVFARGALKASAWLIGKPARLYTIDDVLS
jgi:4-hydroxy-tetrahydrodipicolinate reductase